MKNIFTIVPFLFFSYTLFAQPAITGQPSNSNICAAGNTTFTITATGATGYQWQVNSGAGFTNITDGGVYSGASTATLTITGATAGMTGYTYRCVASGTVTPDATSNAATLTVTSPGTWLGTSNSAWGNTLNWSCATLPTASTNVTIPSGTTFTPIVNITTATCNNLTINSGASMLFTSVAILDIKGSVTNNGTFNASSGKVKFSGAAQSVPGASYKNLEISGSGLKTLGGAATVSTTLILTSGYLQLGANNLTLGNAGTISGASTSSYVITNGLGALKNQNIGTAGKTGAVLFPIGTSTSSYTPVKITNTGTADVFGARVINHVYRSFDASDIPNGAVQNTYNADKTWLLSEGTAGGSIATVNLSWSSFDEQPGFNDGACYSAHFLGGDWLLGPEVTANGFDPYDIDITNVTSFSPFAIGSQFSILPVNLVSFTGKAGATGNVLSWTTANEINFASFNIERSPDGVQFAAIGNVVASVNGNTGGQQYQFTDANPPASSFYRLKMIDKDGAAKYSSILNINSATDNTSVYSLYPNPVTGSLLHIRAKGNVTDNVLINVMDVTGRNWYTGKSDAAALNRGEATININALPAAVYLLRIHNEKTGTVDLLKFTK